MGTLFIHPCLEMLTPPGMEELLNKSDELKCERNERLVLSQLLNASSFCEAAF